MTALAKPRHEPEEREDPRNALLDAAAELIRRCVDHGCEAQIRARLDAILPPPTTPGADSGELWQASVIVTALREARAKIKSPASLRQIETALGFAKQNFEAAKAAQGGAKI